MKSQGCGGEVVALDCPGTGGFAFTCPVSATRDGDGMRDGRHGETVWGWAARREETGVQTVCLRRWETWRCVPSTARAPSTDFLAGKGSSS